MFVVLSDLLLLSSAIFTISLAASTSAIAALVQETTALTQPQGVEIHRPKQASDFAQITPDQEQETAIFNDHLEQFLTFSSLEHFFDNSAFLNKLTAGGCPFHT